MAKISDSKRKFRVAKKFARELENYFGENLRCVLVIGSVASNMALPDSDIDVVAIVKSDKGINSDNYPEIVDIISRANKNPSDVIHFLGVRFKHSLVFNKKLGGTLAAVPLFGSRTFIDWAKEKGIFRYPTRDSAVHVYRTFDWKKPTLAARLAAKRKPQRFA
jgi:predicted nucleotidyltransferase